MRIGIDCRNFYDIYTNRGAGVERYTYHFVRTLLSLDQINEYLLFFYSDLSPETIHKVKGNNARVKIVKLFRASSRIPLIDSHFRFSRILKKEKLDLTIFPANIIPLFYNKKSILIVHDLAIYMHPEWFPEKQWFSIKVLVPRSLKKAQTIVAISESTKRDLMKLFKVPEQKIKVIYPGIVVKSSYLEEEKEKIMKKFDIHGDYVLFIGTIEPRKNISNLIKAFSNYLFENEESKMSLILAGIKGWKFHPIFQSLNEINKRLISSQIKYIGKVTNRERNILIKYCRVFIFPSYYEGFGFPVLEAMALGVPVITSNTSSLVEIAGDCALLVNPDDPNDIRRAIKRVLDDKFLRQQLVSKGKKKAEQFNWQKTIEQFQMILK